MGPAGKFRQELWWGEQISSLPNCPKYLFIHQPSLAEMVQSLEDLGTSNSNRKRMMTNKSWWNPGQLPDSLGTWTAKTHLTRTWGHLDSQSTSSYGASHMNHNIETNQHPPTGHQLRPVRVQQPQLTAYSHPRTIEQNGLPRTSITVLPCFLPMVGPNPNQSLFVTYCSVFRRACLAFNAQERDSNMTEIGSMTQQCC